MSAATANASILGQTERLAMIRRTWGAAIAAGGGDFNARKDAAADETYENIVSGWDMTVLDTALEAGAVGDWSKLARWFDDHQLYFATATTGTPPGLGYSSDPWNTWCEAAGIRVPWEFAELFYNRYGARLDPQNVYPKGLWNANIGDNATARLHQFGEAMNVPTDHIVYTSVDGQLVHSYAPIVMASNGGITGNYSGTIIAKNQAGASKTLTLSAVTEFDTADLQYVLGAAKVTTTADIGATSVSSSGVLAVGGFTTGEWLVLTDGAGVVELVQAGTVSTNAIALATPLLKQWVDTTSFIWPLYTGIVSFGASSSGGEGEAIQVYARPDRAIAL